MIRILAAFLFSLIVGAAQAQVPGGGGPMVPNTAPFIAGSAGSGSYGLLAKSGVASSITGTLTETILATIALPSNLIGANGQIRVNTYWTVTNSVNNKTLRVRLGATGITSSLISSTVATTVASAWIVVATQNLNASNSQNNFTEGSRGTDGLVNTILLTSAVDMTVLENIYITGTLANTGETITLAGYSVEYAN